MKNTVFEPYKRMIIKWYEGGLSCKHYNEKMVIQKDKIDFSRTVDCSSDIKELFDTIKWGFKINDEKHIFRFNSLCECFTNTHDVGDYYYGCDIGGFSVELVFNDNTKLKENYIGNMKDNGLTELIKIIKEFIPKAFIKPYFLG